MPIPQFVIDARRAEQRRRDYQDKLAEKQADGLEWCCGILQDPGEHCKICGETIDDN